MYDKTKNLSIYFVIAQKTIYKPYKIFIHWKIIFA